MIGRVIAACIMAWAGMNLAARLWGVEPVMLDPVALTDDFEEATTCAECAFDCDAICGVPMCENEAQWQAGGCWAPAKYPGEED